MCSTDEKIRPYISLHTNVPGSIFHDVWNGDEFQNYYVDLKKQIGTLIFFKLYTS